MGYAFAAGRVAVAAVAAMPALSGRVSNVFTKTGNIINTNAARRGRLARDRKSVV